MKIRLLVALALWTSPVWAESPQGWPVLKVKGVEYHDVKVVSSDASAIKVTHEAGTARLLLKDLPEEVQAAFGYDVDKAMANERDRRLLQRGVQAEVQRKQWEAGKAEREKQREMMHKSAVAWKPFTVEVAIVYPDGVLGYPHYDAVKARPVGDGDPAEDALSGTGAGGKVGGRKAFTDYKQPMFLPDIKGAAEKALYKGEFHYEGVVVKDGNTYPRWVMRPVEPGKK